MQKKILILNVGSSSVKYHLYKGRYLVTRGEIQRIGEKHQQTYPQAIDQVFRKVGEVDVIGHRIVHGYDITEPTKITSELLSHLEEFSSLAPLHNKSELQVIKYCRKKFRKTQQIALFDTNFFKDLPAHSRTYPIPKKLAEKYKIRRYGFHGESHRYMLEQAKKILKKTNPNLITCHLGNGCSITAIKNSKPVDTSMGFTPLDGIPMGTRSGAIDPGIIFFLSRHGYLVREIEELLNEKSGLLGMSNISKDARDLLSSDSPQARLALNVFTYQVAKQLSSYYGILGKVDAIIFTAGIGQNEPKIRKMILSQIKLPQIKKTKILVIRADESSVMIEQILKLIN
ncbi:MAG: acetate/propionate family kinase [Nanoarchaeota archaeon]|nr:acetate/propionate family kinase [Nanoarchaeota archaeon]